MYNSRRVCPKADSPLLICSLGQLIRENNKPLDKTFVYCYDGIGNISQPVAELAMSTANNLTRYMVYSSVTSSILSGWY